MDIPSFRRLINTIEDVLYGSKNFDEIYLLDGSQSAALLEGSRWIPLSGKSRLRVDTPHVKGQQVHGHLYGKKGKEIGVINIDGTGSHGTSMRLTKGHANALRSFGFKVRDDRMVEWIIDSDPKLGLLLG